MYYYVVAILNSNQTFTYQYAQKIPLGTIVSISLKQTLKNGVIIQESTKPAYKTKDILEITSFFYDASALKTAHFISSYYFSDISSALKLFTPSIKNQTHFTAKAQINKPKLNAEQYKAFTSLKQNKKNLLFGVTGSGKTELYISYIYEILQQNKTALILLPEISLTPQIEKRLQSFFGDIVGVWHSKLTKKQKEKFLDKFYGGEIGLVVGARSALFLPYKDLGVIVVDEEHDDSYKSSQKPRYHARDMALYIAHHLDIAIILSSATPTLSSYIKFPVVKLEKTYIQTQKKYKFINSNDFDDYFVSLLKENADNQSIVFIPTRGNFKYLKCNACGEFIKCPYCSVGMSIHLKSNALKCHYCNYSQAISQTCPSCHELSLSSQRVGTAQVIKQLEPIENLKPLQFDADTITTNKKLKTALQNFENGENNLLIGTQMLSKGHDYPNVTLSLIVGLDYILAQADFRAREKALSLFFQIAGRCGRNKDATVVLQTANEIFFNSYISDYEKFLLHEKEFRKGLYPPYTTIAKLLFAHKNQILAQQKMQKIVDKLQTMDIEVVGFGANIIEKIANRYRFNILLRSNDKKKMHKTIHQIYDGSFEVDMDCIHFD